jgi:ribosome recycling factor
MVVDIFDMSVITFIYIIGMVLVAKLRIFCETTKKIGKIFGGLTEKRYFCHQKTLKLSKIMIDVKETLKKSEERMEMAAMFLEEELNRVRAGRANVAILDGVRVELYGSKVPLNQVANVSVPDPRTIAIKPWDRKEIRNIEKAIMDSDVGITPENNGEIIRLNIPVPTEERRKDLVKQCNKICEKAKVEVRNVRADIKDKLKKAIKDGLSEDNEKDAEQELQKLHDKYIKKLDDLMAAKNKEIMTV